MSREDDTPEKPKRARRRGRKRILALLLLLGLLAWLNGPGWRWLGGIGLRHALEKSGLSGEFELAGTLVGGVRVERIALSGGPIRTLEIGSAGPLYQFRRLLRGEIEGVEVERVNAVIDLAGPPLPKNPGSGPASEPADLPEALRKIRSLLLPLDLRAADFRFQLVRGDESLLTLGNSNFTHAAGSNEFLLDLGKLAAGPKYEFPAQRTAIRWTEEFLTLDRFFLTPRLGVRDLQVGIPTTGEPTAVLVLEVEDSRIDIAGDRKSASLRLGGAPLPVHEAARNLAVELPVEATVRSFEAELSGFDQSPDRWQVNARAGIEGIRHQDWQAENLVADIAKAGDTATLDAAVAAYDGELLLDGDLRWRDLAAGQWTDFEATARASVPRLAPLFAALNEKLGFVPATAAGLPESSLTLDATVDSGPAGPRAAGGRWLLSAAQDAPSIAGENQWTSDGKLGGSLGSDGLRATYALDLAARTYDASATFDRFQPARLAPWAAAAGVELPTGMSATGSWQGSGGFAPEPHRGTFAIPSFEWVRPDAPPVQVRTNGSYSWPETVILDDLTATADGQTIHAEATLADRVLSIPRLEWRDGAARLVGGRAEIPLPEKPGDVKEFLKQDLPLSVFLESDWIDAARLAAWLPDKKSPPADGSGRVQLVVTGTPAEPKIHLETALRGLRLPGQPEVPVTDATLTLDGAGDALTLAGELRPASFPRVTLSGRMPFKPGVWAENPAAAMEERFESRVNIPRLDLAALRNFLPPADRLAGNLEGFVTAGGSLAKPELGGELRLSGAAFEMPDSAAPPVSNLNALVRLRGSDVRLESLALESSGGTLNGSGTVGLADPARPTLDFAFRAIALPLKRDEAMIIRADANLTLRGDLERATISGTVDLVDSLYYRDFEILPVRVPFTAPSRPRLPAIDPDERAADFPAPFANWALDVRVRTRDPLLIRGNLATGSATADIRFGGTLGTIQPQGIAIIRDVTARLPFSTLRVQNGTVTFTPAGGLDPELNIRGSSNIGRFDVNVFFYGPVSAPRTAMTSDPPLAESEIMTLLATGTTSSGLEDGQAATMKAAQLFIEEWRRGRLPFGEQLAKALQLLNNVDVRVGEDDPLTGRRLNSATIEVTDRIVLSGSVDREGNTRVLGAFVIRFK
jgi:hypothetical protein